MFARIGIAPLDFCVRHFVCVAVTRRDAEVRQQGLADVPSELSSDKAALHYKTKFTTCCNRPETIQLECTHSTKHRPVRSLYRLRAAVEASKVARKRRQLRGNSCAPMRSVSTGKRRALVVRQP